MSKAKAIKTREEFESRIRDLTELIKEKTIVFPNDTADMQLARIKEAKGYLPYFAKTYFPHYISSPFADFHIEEMEAIAAALDSKDASIIAEAWSRGFGKSSLLANILPLWAAITRKSQFCIFVGADKELAMERTASIRVELMHNARLRYDFPEVGMEEGGGEEHDFALPIQCRMRAQGYKMGIRGKTYGPHRPRLIIVDDLESHKDANPKLSEAKLRYVLDEAFCAFGDKGGVLVWLGNLTHSHHALALFEEQCKNDTENKYIRFRKVIAEENGISNWAEAFPIPKLKAIASVIGKNSYARQYLMKPGIDGEVFKEDWLRFYNPFSAPDRETLQRFEMTGLGFRLPTREELLAAPTVSYCDPSLGNGESNDYKAIITVAFWGGVYFILDVWVQKATIMEMLEYFYDLDKRFKTRQFMETNFWQKIIYKFLPQVAAGKGYTISLSGVENRLNKQERILSLQPLFEQGLVVHCVLGNDFARLKEQLMGFPNAGYDDAPDALSGAIERFKELANANQYQTIQSGAQSFMGMF
ncbi:MAG: phage terminase large subunit [Candidatus Cloacimonetes bacterium]|nr:phage terminase large subunit [Candidatus Cloacimonadota bacterium]